MTVTWFSKGFQKGYDVWREHLLEYPDFSLRVVWWFHADEIGHFERHSRTWLTQKPLLVVLWHYSFVDIRVEPISEVKGILITSYTPGTFAFNLPNFSTGNDFIVSLSVLLESIDKEIALMMIIQLNTMRNVPKDADIPKLTMPVARPKMADSKSFEC